MPPNLHEFDIVVADLRLRDPVPYSDADHGSSDSANASQGYVLCEFPQTVFDPRPLAGTWYEDTIGEILKKESVVVVFAAGLSSVSYQLVELTPRGLTRQREATLDNYSLLPLQRGHNKKGRQTIVANTAKNLAVYLREYSQEFEYEITFEHPAYRKEGVTVEDPNFTPLMTNQAGEIVSYVQFWNENSALFVFPQMKNKARFLLQLFQEYLPAIKPKLFPFSTQFAWLGDEEYRLPNEKRLFEEKQKLEQEYSARRVTKESEIEENHQRYRFLHDLLTQTDQGLVRAAEWYFKWLGFDRVENRDEEHPGRKEEDLQISLTEGLLVVEVKGIGGTSKDEECSQIGKIKYRRAQERGSFDVSALYVVNHQRYLSPENRQNPPFSDQQKKDAKNEQRGLLTTYDLFKLYFAIEAGFVKKEDARRSLLDFGLVTFRPSDSVPIGTPLEIHHGGKVGIFALAGAPTRVGDELIVCENGRFRKTKVASLQAQDKDVLEASDDEIGIMLSDKISKSSQLWKPMTEPR
jgi:hypothetical protein